MKILHTVEFYHPSQGGAQEVVRQISERLASRGHSVTVATTRLKNRKTRLINRVKIEEFDISGNAVEGIHGEVQRYQHFLVEGKFDIMMNYAAQQWATDLVFPVLSDISYKKILIPCGFSGLYQPSFADYFSKLPEIMRQYDHLIFNANDYRDINFARWHRITQWTLIPNGASQDEFAHVDTTFRKRYGIPKNAFVLLTVGGHTGAKGHQLVLDAQRKLQSERVVLIIIGYIPSRLGLREITIRQFLSWYNLLRALFLAIINRHIEHFGKLTLDFILRTLFGGPALPGCLQDCRIQRTLINLTSGGKKRVLLLNPSRADVVAAYHAADLFVFGSNIEYSPLVLFEAMASFTPFLTLACGNAAEIVAWSNGGRLASTIIIDRGMVGSDAETFAREIDDLINDPAERTRLAENGYQAWCKRFTWEKIVDKYEELYVQLNMRQNGIPIRNINKNPIS